jgi:hypothetical protein
VRPLKAGFAKILVSPDPADLAWAEGEVPTPHGQVKVRFDRTPNRFRLELELPRSARVELPLPNEYGARVSLDGKPVDGERIAGRVVLDVAAGRHVLDAVPRA